MTGFDEASLADDVGGLPPGNCLVSRQSSVGCNRPRERSPVEIAGRRHADNFFLRRIKRADIGHLGADLFS